MFSMDHVGVMVRCANLWPYWLYNKRDKNLLVLWIFPKDKLFSSASSGGPSKYPVEDSYDKQAQLCFITPLTNIRKAEYFRPLWNQANSTGSMKVPQVVWRSEAGADMNFAPTIKSVTVVRVLFDFLLSGRSFFLPLLSCSLQHIDPQPTSAHPLLEKYIYASFESHQTLFYSSALTHSPNTPIPLSWTALVFFCTARGPSNYAPLVRQHKSR